MLHTTDATTWITSMMIIEAWSQCIEVLKQQFTKSCCKFNFSLISELEKQFRTQKLLNVLG